MLQAIRYRLILFQITSRTLLSDVFLQVLQRVYKYGGQPFVRDYLALHYGTDFDRTFGAKTGKAMMHSLAGRYVCQFFECDLELITFLA